VRNRTVFVADLLTRIERNRCGYRKVSRAVDMAPGLLGRTGKSSSFFVIGNLIQKLGLPRELIPVFGFQGFQPCSEG